MEIRIRRRGGKAFIVTPDGRPLSPAPAYDRTLIKALRSAHLWRPILPPIP